MKQMTTTIPRGRSLGRRLIGVLAVTLLIALAGSAFGAWSLKRIALQTQEFVDKSVLADRYVADWYRNVVVAIRRTTAVAVSADASLADFFAADAAASSKATTELQDKVGALMKGDDEKRVYAQIGEIRKGYMLARDAVSALKKAGDAEGARKVLDEKYIPAAAKYQEQLQQLSEIQRRQIDEAGKRIQSANHDAQIALIVFGVLALGVGAVLAVWLIGSITRPIQRAVDAANRIAGLDLTEHIESHDRDETGRLLMALESMQRALRELVTQVRTSTDNISTASAEIADGSKDLSSRTEQAAANLQQTAASIEQMNGTVQQSATNSRNASELATGAAQVALKGGEVVAQVVSTMQEINGSSKKIADIIGVIDGIAFQTNILALNAAVEAARAGEQGRGFAVVASEVRSLAHRSAEAAKEIKSLIGASVDKVDSGTKLVADAGKTMSEVVSSVKRVSDIIAAISLAANEQSQGIGQVNTAIAQLDQATQQNAALVEESAAAAGSLKSQAQHLAETVQQFRV